jgi:hypothetical protein
MESTVDKKRKKKNIVSLKNLSYMYLQIDNIFSNAFAGRAEAFLSEGSGLALQISLQRNPQCSGLTLERSG